jgi:transposase
MAYSEDYRKKTLEYCKEGHTQEETAAVFNVDPKTIRDWERRMKEGILKATYPKTRKPRKLPPAELSCYVEEHPDAFLDEIGSHFGCSGEAVRKALKKLKITLKKRQSATKSVAKPLGSNTNEK